MKKIVWVVLLGLMVFGLLFSAAPALADDGENFEQAGQRASQEREQVLMEKKAEIETFVYGIAEDGLIAKYEMLDLRTMVDDFNRTKERFDKELRLYDRATSIVLEEGYKKAIDAYFFNDILFKADNGDEDARKFFASATGQDVVIQKAPVFHAANIFFMIVTAFALFVTIVSITARKVGVAVVCGLLFVGFLLLLLLV